MRAKVVIIEPFEAYEEIEGEVAWLPFCRLRPHGR